MYIGDVGQPISFRKDGIECHLFGGDASIEASHVRIVLLQVVEGRTVASRKVASRLSIFGDKCVSIRLADRLIEQVCIVSIDKLFIGNVDRLVIQWREAAGTKNPD